MCVCVCEICRHTVGKLHTRIHIQYTSVCGRCQLYSTQGSFTPHMVHASRHSHMKQWHTGQASTKDIQYITYHLPACMSNAIVQHRCLDIQSGGSMHQSTLKYSTAFRQTGTHSIVEALKIAFLTALCRASALGRRPPFQTFRVVMTEPNECSMRQ